MTAMKTPHPQTITGWPFQVYKPAFSPPNKRIMLLLHGYEGNENVMWVLTNPIPDNYALLAPRAPVQCGPDQYCWHTIAPQWPDMDVYRSLADSLIERVDQWAAENNWPAQQIDVMGFSQGAVLALAMGILYPEKIGRTAILAGFLPQAWKSQLQSTQEALAGKPFFIAHGTRDEVIPIAKAHYTAEWLKEKSADVTFCEADTGHKISANCFNGLGEFFS
jgi:phospholipase/carboxylesterase